MTLVFVYGTLRRGGENHGLLEHVRCVSVTRTQPAFTLYDLGAYPAMVAGGVTAVEGETYEVDAATLARLDQLEGCPGYYHRIETSLEDGRVAQTYTMQPGQVLGHAIIPEGRWPLRSANATS